ncbi:hypothetical protein FUAX_05600 [Fulvitalea axinellae]|uniref:CSD domain-containing protein n=1 Tax=Fulvitalea axinellae TaxID=1182444 RepID=A0AAU9CEA6_9BACT|nr:hypothetical protein FUAX_05600 [Fulvitalea axinellae]
MAKSQETFSKKEKEKKRLKKRQDKQQKKAERRAASAENAGSGLDDMMVYVDENGFLSTTPPDETKKKKEIDAESIEIGVPKREKEDEEPLTGRVDFFNHSKGFGFIRDLDSRERYFFHVNGLMEPVDENDKVTFELENGMKGLNAVRVKKI